MEVVVLLSSGSSQPTGENENIYKKEVRQPQEKIKRKKLENLLQTWDIIGGNLKLGKDFLRDTTGQQQHQKQKSLIDLFWVKKN